MRITELVGSDQIRSWRTSVANDIHGNWRTMARTLLAEKGFTRIGQGFSGDVYEHPNLDYVLKVFKTNDRLYLRWLRFAQHYQSNPYVPRFRGNLIKLSNFAYAIRMERFVSTASDAAYASKLLIAQLNSDTPMDPRDISLIEMTFPDFENDESLQQVLQFLRGFPNNLDLSTENVMKRPNKQIVFVDPLAEN